MHYNQNDLLSFWSIQDNLLQTYRILFLTSESILLSISSVVLSMQNTTSENFFLQVNKYDIIFFSLFIIGIIILFFWIKVSKSRGYDVSYIQSLILEYENTGYRFDRKKIMNKLKEWQKRNKKEKEKYLDERNLLKSPTRSIMNKKIPYTFLSIWLLL